MVHYERAPYSLVKGRGLGGSLTLPQEQVFETIRNGLWDIPSQAMGSLTLSHCGDAAFH